jgi:hypothetical protein
LMLCDLSGRTCYSEDMRQMWNGLWVHKDYWEPRNPQDFVYAIRDQMAPAVVRPDTDGTVWLPTNTTPVPTPPVLTAYPLDDDGTVAAQFGVGWLETDAPDYTSADYTYTGAATGGRVIATPAAANIFTSQAVTVTSADILSLEMVIDAVVASQFSSVGMGALVLPPDSNTPLLVLGISASNVDGSTPLWVASGISDQVRTSSITGFRVGIDIDGAAGTITMKSTDGSVVSSDTFTAPVRIVASLQVVDSGVSDPGDTTSLRLIVPAADYTLPCPAGAKNLLGDVIP